MRNTLICIVIVSVIACISGCAVLTPLVKKDAGDGELIVTYWDADTTGRGHPRFETRMRVYVDGELAGESEILDRYSRKTVTVPLPPGKHSVIVEGLARKDGLWEFRAKGEGTSIDHRITREVEIVAGQKQLINFVIPDVADKMKIRL